MSMDTITYACPHNGEPGRCRRTKSEYGGGIRRDPCVAKHTHRIEQDKPGRCPDHKTDLVQVTS